MKIIRLESENIKRLHAVEIKPDGSLIIIGGKNAQGKTSALDSIEYLFSDKSHLPDEPVHRGAKEGRIMGETEDLIIKKVITGSRKTSDLKVKAVITNKQNFPVENPQTILNSFYGDLTFDPLKFLRMKPDEQLKIVKELAGIDFSDMDNEKKKIYDERTLVNTIVKTLRSQFEGTPKYEGVPESEVSYTELLGEQKRIFEKNQQNDKRQEEYNKLVDEFERSKKNLDDLREKIKRLRQEWDVAVVLDGQLEALLLGMEKEIGVLVYEDANIATSKISEIEEINQKVRSNLKRNELLFDLELRQQQSEKITKRLEEIEDEKLKLISSSKLPIQGLTFDSSTLYYDGIPFTDQSSSAEQLRVSVAMGFAMNPKLKILLIRDGSLLDEDNLKMIAEMAEKEGGQLWLERVGEGKECQVIIEDGRVKL